MEETLKDRIVFSTGNGFVSRAIRWLTRSKASHVSIVYYDVDFERDMLMEATGDGFHMVSFEKFKSKNKIVGVYEPKYSLEKGLKVAAEKLGEKYDFGGLFGMLWVLLGRWLRRKWYNPLQSNQALFCSEAVADIFADSAYPSFELIPSRTDPQDLIEFLEEEKRAA